MFGRLGEMQEHKMQEAWGRRYEAMRRVKSLSLTVLPERLAVCRLAPDELVPECPAGTRFWSATRTDEELSVVLPEESVPASWQTEKGYRGLKVLGPLALGLTGVLASLAMPLAEAGVSIFAISTYDTDYILVREGDLEKAKRVLLAGGHTVAAWPER